MDALRKYLPASSIFCLALFVRLLYNFTVAWGYVPRFDAAIYHIIAQHLVNNHCFCLFSSHPTVGRAPLWPFILAGIYLFTGPQSEFGRLFLAVLGSATCLLVFLLARSLFGRYIALAVGVLAATYTGLFIYDGWLYAESLYTFLLAAFVYAAYRFQETSKLRWSILIGLTLGLATLTRPNGSILFVLLLVWVALAIWAKMVEQRTAVRGVLLAALVALLVIAPWTLRNYIVTRTFVPVATGSGDVLIGAYNDTVLRDNPVGRGMWVANKLIVPEPNFPEHDSYSGDYMVESQKVSYALHWIITHLSDMPYLLGLHFVNMWMSYTFEPGLPAVAFPERPASQVVWHMMLIMPVLIFLLAGAGLLLTWKHFKKPLLIIYLVLVVTILQNIAFYSNIRFRAPIEPLLVLLAGGTLWWLATHWMTRCTGMRLRSLAERFQKPRSPGCLRVFRWSEEDQDGKIFGDAVETVLDIGSHEDERAR